MIVPAGRLRIQNTFLPRIIPPVVLATLEAVMDFADEPEMGINRDDCSVARVLVIDKWTRIAWHTEASKQIIWVIQAISQEGAGYNMFLVLGGQLLNPRAIGSGEVLQSIHAAYVHRLDMKQAMYVLQNSKEAKKTSILKTGVSLLNDTKVK